MVDTVLAIALGMGDLPMKAMPDTATVEDALFQERQLMRALLDHIPDRVYFKDVQGRFICISRSLAALFGLSDPALAVGKTDADFFTVERAEQTLRDEQEIIASGRPIVEIEEKETWPDGRETWVSTTKMPLRDEQGKIIGVFGISRDITERVRRAQMLAALHETALDLAAQRALPDLGRAILERAIGLLKAKDGSIFLYRPATDDLERILAFNIKPSEAPIVLRRGEGLAGRALETGRPFVVDDYDRWEGRVRQYEENFAAVAVPILWAERPLGVLVIGDRTPRVFSEADVTLLERFAPLAAAALENARLIRDLEQRVEELQRTQAQLIETAKLAAIGQLAAGVAHEVNNPLSAMMQGAQVVSKIFDLDHPATLRRLQACGVPPESLARYLDERGVTEYLEGIREQGKRAAKIVSDLLQYAHFERAQVASCDLNALIEQSLALAMADYDLRKKYDFREVEIVQELAPHLPAVRCDRQQIQQAVLNLVRNAAQAMLEKRRGVGDDYSPRLTLRTRWSPENSCVRLEVEDNGPGVPGTMRARVFEPFFTTKGVGDGAGLGLWVCYSIIAEWHQGRIWVEDGSEGGARFVVELPVEAPKGLE